MSVVPTEKLPRHTCLSIAFVIQGRKGIASLSYLIMVGSRLPRDGKLDRAVVWPLLLRELPLKMPVGTVTSNYWETGPPLVGHLAGLGWRPRTARVCLFTFFSHQAGGLQPWDLGLGLTLLWGLLPIGL